MSKDDLFLFKWFGFILVIVILLIVVTRNSSTIDGIESSGETCARLLNYTATKNDSSLIFLARRDCDPSDSSK